MPASRPNPPQIDLAQDWLEYSAQNHGQRLELLRFSLAALVTLLVLLGGFRIVTDSRQEPDLQKLAIGLMGTVLGASLSSALCGAINLSSVTAPASQWPGH